MEALTSLTKWIPEDDRLLKNAVEEGASLESLAKGAVPFSHRYTIRELQARWLSLLYDLDTSTEASSRIFDIETELAALNFQKSNRACNSNSKGKELSSEKRKAVSVRSHYYALRKRIRCEPQAECINKKQSFNRDFHQRDFPSIPGDNLTSIDKSLDLHEMSQPSVLGTRSLYENDAIVVKHLTVFDSSKVDEGMHGAGLNNPTVMPENEFLDFSDTFMDFADGLDLPCIIVNENDNADRTCRGLSSILLSSPSDTHHGKTTMSFTSSKTSPLEEPRQEFMLCVLNTEDSVIPSNDHVLSTNQNDLLGDLNIGMELAVPVQPTISSLKASPSTLQKVENHLEEADDAKLNPLNGDNSPHSDLVSAEILPASNQEEQFSDNEDVVPYTSDIESMILDMDLGPLDPKPCLPSREVSRFHHMDIKRTIRWEQGFHSHMNRSISSRGAYAVFYGRHLKYFIKDPEVSIGRDTADAKVDINLGREGHTNRISRRQAIIKMGEGAFYLMNIGKFSIFVNGKEVPPKKRVNLPSRSLVKIQDMIFAFDVKESTIRALHEETGTKQPRTEHV